MGAGFGPWLNRLQASSYENLKPRRAIAMGLTGPPHPKENLKRHFANALVQARSDAGTIATPK